MTSTSDGLPLLATDGSVDLEESQRQHLQQPLLAGASGSDDVASSSASPAVLIDLSEEAVGGERLANNLQMNNLMPSSERSSLQLLQDEESNLSSSPIPTNDVAASALSSSC